MTPDERNGGTPARGGQRTAALRERQTLPHSGPVDAFLLSFAVIFVAELGDKSQLMALTFATRFRALPVLVGIGLATLLVHLGSVAIGATRRQPAADPADRARSAASRSSGSRRGRSAATRSTRARSGKAEAATGSVILAVGVAFFIAELGDKTMLATIALATREDLLGVWLGSTAGMIAADALAIGVGRWLGTRLPERVVRIGAAAAFLVFGVVLIVGAIAG